MTVTIGMLSIGERYIDIEGANGKVRYLQNSNALGDSYVKTQFWSAKQQDGNTIVKDKSGEIKSVVLYEFPDGSCYLSGYIEGDGMAFWMLELPKTGYYRVLSHDERIEHILDFLDLESSMNDNFYERFDTDICTVIYYEQLPIFMNRTNSYGLIIVYMNGDFIKITNLPLNDLALSDDGTKLTYISVMNGKTYEVDLATAEVSEKK